MDNSNDQLPYLTLRLGNSRYALPVAAVVEVSAMVELESLPDAHSAVMGLANRHGEPLPIIDLRQFFHLPGQTITADTLFVVVQGRDQKYVGLVVDEVYQVIYIGQSVVRTAPGAGMLVHQIASVNGEMYQIISLESLLMALVPPANQANEG